MSTNGSFQLMSPMSQGSKKIALDNNIIELMRQQEELYQSLKQQQKLINSKEIEILKKE